MRSRSCFSPYPSGIFFLGICIALFLSCAFFFGSEASPAESGAFPLLGEWAYDYEPTVLVLRLEANGNAWYLGKDYTWADQGSFLKLADPEGNTLMLRYAVSETQKVIYPRTFYRRGTHVEGEGGLIGVWEGVSDGSSFVFTPAGYFLEDSAFSGNFMADPEAGTFLLHYGEVFADTLCYYGVENEILSVEYPWVIVAKQSS